MNKKLIFFDMDGTLIDHRVNQVPKSTQEAIRQLKEQGHVCAIATGRCPSLLYGFDEQLGIQNIIASNGRYVKVGDNVIQNLTMPKERVLALTQHLESFEIGVAYQTADAYAAKSLFGDAHILFAQHYNEEVPKITPNFTGFDDVLQMIIYTKDALPDEVIKAFSDVRFTKSCDYGYDVTMGEGLKEVGVEKLCHYLGFSKEDTLAIGDGLNDISMFRHVGLSVAMGNAHKEVKEAADLVTESVDEDGIYNILKKLNLI